MRTRNGVIYFLQVEGGGPIKIGFTCANPADRAKALQRSSPYLLTWIGYFPAASTIEAELHKLFASDRIRSEWFHPTQRIYDFIAAKCPNFSAAAAVEQIFCIHQLRQIQSIVGNTHNNKDVFRECLKEANADIWKYNGWCEGIRAPNQELLAATWQAVDIFQTKNGKPHSGH